MAIIDKLAEVINGTGQIFSFFFDFSIQYVILPLVLFVFLVIFFFAQYYLIKAYIWLGVQAWQGAIKIIEILRFKEETIINKILGKEEIKQNE